MFDLLLLGVCLFILESREAPEALPAEPRTAVGLELPLASVAGGDGGRVCTGCAQAGITISTCRGLLEGLVATALESTDDARPGKGKSEMLGEEAAVPKDDFVEGLGSGE